MESSAAAVGGRGPGEPRRPTDPGTRLISPCRVCSGHEHYLLRLTKITTDKIVHDNVSSRSLQFRAWNV